MARRLLQLLALAVAVAVAIGAGTLVRRHLEGPDPVDTVRAATRAYATGDCSALKEVSETPVDVRCSDVTQIRDSYRSQGLRPSTFAYDLVARQGDVATVRISYERDGTPQEEIVRLERRAGDWKIAPPVSSFG